MRISEARALCNGVEKKRGKHRNLVHANKEKDERVFHVVTAHRRRRKLVHVSMRSAVLESSESG